MLLAVSVETLKGEDRSKEAHQVSTASLRLKIQVVWTKRKGRSDERGSDMGLYFESKGDWHGDSKWNKG